MMITMTIKMVMVMMMILMMMMIIIIMIMIMKIIVVMIIIIKIIIIMTLLFGILTVTLFYRVIDTAMLRYKCHRDMYPCKSYPCENGTLDSSSSIGTIILLRVWCRYNAVNCLENYHKIHPIARPLGRGMGCFLWIYTLIYILLR